MASPIDKSRRTMSSSSSISEIDINEFTYNTKLDYPIVSLEEVIRDTHMQGVFLQFLSKTDSKDFARLLFLVSVDEFKKMFYSNDPCNTTSIDEEDGSCQSRKSRILYAIKIIKKYMTRGSFLDITSDNLKILNKSVWTFGRLLENELKTSEFFKMQKDLFHDAEAAVRSSLQNGFKRFMKTKEYQDLVHYAPIESTERKTQIDQSINENIPLSTSSIDSSKNDFVVSNKNTNISNRGSHRRCSLGLKQLLHHRRLCCIFWVYLYKERTHQPLSLWMEIEYQMKPLYEECLNGQDETKNMEKFWKYGNLVCKKYLNIGASTEVCTICDKERIQFDRVINLMEMTINQPTMESMKQIFNLLEQIQLSLQANLRVNHFVRFIRSQVYKDAIEGYQKSFCTWETQSESSDSSMTSLPEIICSMNLPCHLPQRISQHFDIYGMSSPISPITAVLSFRMNLNHKKISSFRDQKDFLINILYQANDENGEPCVIPEHLDAFFAPCGVEFVQSKTQPESQLFTMTIGNTDKPLYAAVFTRFCRVKENEMGPIERAIASVEEKGVMYAPTGICIFSKYPLMNTLRNRLQELHLEATNEDLSIYQDDCMWIPTDDQVDKLISPLNEIKENSKKNSFPSCSIPPIDFSLTPLFGCLSLKHIVQVLRCILMEHRIILVSSSFTTLTSVGESFRTLIHPLFWSHVFVPLLPKTMLECLHCPTPYLFGLHRSYAQVYSILSMNEDVVIVDLDKNEIFRNPQSLRNESCHLPLDLEKELITDLQRMMECPPNTSIDTPIECENIVHFPQIKIRQRFSSFIHSLMKSINLYCFTLSDDWDQIVVFDEDGFLSQLKRQPSISPSTIAFYQAFFRTQILSQYVATAY